MQNDGGETSHRVNHECGFIQTNNHFALGTRFEGGNSQVGGNLYFITASLYRATGPAVWWLSINEVALGYFDPGMFPVPFIESFHNEMGGRVLDSRPGGRHTTTPMGSGMFPSSGSIPPPASHATWPSTTTAATRWMTLSTASSPTPSATMLRTSAEIAIVPVWTWPMVAQEAMTVIND